MKHYKILRKDEKVENENLIHQIENENEFKFPSSFKLFHSQYKCGRQFEIWESYLDKFLRPTPMTTISLNYKDQKYPYNWICSLNELIHGIKYYDQVNEMLKEDGLLRFGDMVHKGGLYVGVKDFNRDEIFLYYFNDFEKPIKVCDNIFDLIELLDISKKYDAQLFEKPASSKYWIKKDIELLVNKNLIENYKNFQLDRSNYIDSQAFFDKLNII